MIRLYARLGDKMDSVIDKIRKYFTDRTELSASQVKDIEDLLKLGGGTLVGILGIGSCYDLGVQFAGFPEI